MIIQISKLIMVSEVFLEAGSSDLVLWQEVTSSSLSLVTKLAGFKARTRFEKHWGGDALAS